MRVGGQRHAPAVLSPGKTRYPLYRRLGGPRAGLEGYGKPPPTGIRSPDVQTTETELPRIGCSVHRLSFFDVLSFSLHFKLLQTLRKVRLRPTTSRFPVVFLRPTAVSLMQTCQLEHQSFRQNHRHERHELPSLRSTPPSQPSLITL